ncbi:uncharacterized protein LOC136043080 isoform X2 [Artemia franciscana]|uniref:uncharacterized protein LOC136043080 isoform X2 n=1 Tax=Artemia franciscana TaxID=6661 RepID=UPI0032DAB8E8
MIEIIRALSEERQIDGEELGAIQFPKIQKYLRSDSKRSSTERSVEEFSFNDHILSTLRTASPKQIPKIIEANPNVQQYASSILSDIFAYTLSYKNEELTNKQINGSEKSLTSGVHSQSELSDTDSDSFRTDGDKRRKPKCKTKEKTAYQNVIEIKSNVPGSSNINLIGDLDEKNSDSGVTIRCSSEKSGSSVPYTSEISAVTCTPPSSPLPDYPTQMINSNFSNGHPLIEIQSTDKSFQSDFELNNAQGTLDSHLLKFQNREHESSAEVLLQAVPTGAGVSSVSNLQRTGTTSPITTIQPVGSDNTDIREEIVSFTNINKDNILPKKNQMIEVIHIGDKKNEKNLAESETATRKPLKSILINRSASFNEPVKTTQKLRRSASNPNSKLRQEKWEVLPVPVLRDSDSKTSLDVLSDVENDFLDRDLMAEERNFHKSKEMKVFPEDRDELPVLLLNRTQEQENIVENSSDSDSEFSFTLEISSNCEQVVSAQESAVVESVPGRTQSIGTSEWNETECVTLLSAKPLAQDNFDNNILVREMISTGSHMENVHTSFVREVLSENECFRNFTRVESLSVIGDNQNDNPGEMDTSSGIDFNSTVNYESESIKLISYSDLSVETKNDDPSSNDLEELPPEDSALTRYFNDLNNHSPLTNRKQPITHILEKSKLEDSLSSDTTLIDDPDQTLGGESDSSICEDIRDVSMDESNFDVDSYGESERMEDQESNYSESLSSGDEVFADREEELRGYNRPIDFTLHTIMEESCEESDSERLKRGKVRVQPDPTSLEKYFKFELCGNNPNDIKFANEESEFSDSISETSSSIYSEMLENIEDETDPVELASSRLEKYFLTGFLGLDPYGVQKKAQKSEESSDDSQSVGSDSEGHPSPEQKRKKVIKLRGFRNQQRQERPDSICSDISVTPNQGDEKEIRAETPTTSEEETAFEKTDGQFDTIKRHKKRRSTGEEIENAKKALNFSFESETVSDGEIQIQEEEIPVVPTEPVAQEPVIQEEMKKVKSRDSGFVGSCDDLLNETKSVGKSKEEIKPEQDVKQVVTPSQVPPTPPSSSKKLSRKDSFNNWSSDEETNLMMNKMRAFFRNMISKSNENSVSTPIPTKSPQMLAFEAELTRLMKTVPGINDEQVKEIVEYLSSEDTWSDSYDSSDYTSSDLEGAYAAFDPSVLNFNPKSELQEQISASCQEIIGQFERPTKLSPILSSDNIVPPIPAGEDLSNSLNRETAFVYQRLVTSLIRLNKQPETISIKANMTPSQTTNTSGSSPPIVAAALQHIGNRLVALMHEVSANNDSNPNFDCVGDESLSKKQQIPRPQPGKFPAPTPPLSHPSTPLSDSPTDNELSTESDDNQGIQNPNSIEKIASLLPFISPRKIKEEIKELTSLESPGRAPVPLPRAKLQDRLRKSAEPSPTDFDRCQLSSSQSSRSASHENILDSEDSIRSKLSARFYKLNRESREALQSSSSGVSDIAERDDDTYWRSSFESAIAADSRTKLSIEAKRRSAGSGSSNEHFGSSELHLEREARRLRSSAKPSSKFSLPNLLERDLNQVGRGREGEREKSASSDVLLTTSPLGSRSVLNTIDQGEEPEEEWDRLRQSRASARRRSSVPDTREDQRTSIKDEERSTTLPRTTGPVSLSTITQAATSKSQFSVHRDETPSPLEATVRSARYRPPGFKHQLIYLRSPMRAPSAPGLSSESTVNRPWSEGSSTVQRRYVKSVIEDDVFDGDNSSLATSSPSIRREGFKGGTWTGSSTASTPRLSAVPSDTTSEGSERSFLGTPKLRGSIFGLSTRSDSLASVCSAAGDVRYGAVPVKGEVQFGIHYNYRQAAFEVAVKMCKDLAPVDTKRNRSDPYVKVYLLPDRSKSGKRKTKVKRHTLSPVFEEILKFYVSLEELELRTLWLSVWHSDMFGRNDFLGEVTIPLAGRVFDDPQPKWFPLQERSDSLDDSASILTSRGDLIIALKYVTVENLQGSRRGKKSRGALQVLVREARNLMPLRLTGIADPLCKASLLPERGKSAKQKTNVCRRTLNPCWNHTFVFDDVTSTELETRTLEITVWDHERVASNEFMGGIRLGCEGMHNGRPDGWADSVGPEVSLWQDVLERPGMWCEGTVPLRSTLGKSLVSPENQ